MSLLFFDKFIKIWTSILVHSKAITDLKNSMYYPLIFLSGFKVFKVVKVVQNNRKLRTRKYIDF